ncbi:MAG: hypothetical protein LC772_10450 [Chloroflexi bacterium]|nr:hypothetical protein [Chloroflexota bacterium]
MDPISLSIEFEIGSFLLGLAGLVATWLHSRQSTARYEQRERHHRENLAAGQHGAMAEASAGGE